MSHEFDDTGELYYIIEDGTNHRRCFDTENTRPKIYDSSEIAQIHINWSKEGKLASRKTFVPISISDYNKKYRRNSDE